MQRDSTAATALPAIDAPPPGSSLDRIELQTLILVRHFELLRRRSDFYSQLDRAAYLLLRTLENTAPMDLRSLASVLGLDRSTAGRQVAAMADRGYVRTSAGEDDRRRTMVTPTKDGLSVMNRVRELRRRSTAELLAGWDDEDMAALADHFTRYNDTVKAHYLPDAE